jgi:hypothetical protein
VGLCSGGYVWGCVQSEVVGLCTVSGGFVWGCVVVDLYWIIFLIITYII